MGRSLMTSMNLTRLSIDSSCSDFVPEYFPELFTPSQLLGFKMSTRHVLVPTTRILSATSTTDILCWINQSLDDGATELLLDLRNVMFMDSSGLGTLVVALTRVQAMGGTFALCSLGGQARMLLEETDTEQMFTIYSDRQMFEQRLAAA
jgi:anti-anti-sigma factor